MKNSKKEGNPQVKTWGLIPQHRAEDYVKRQPRPQVAGLNANPPTMPGAKNLDSTVRRPADCLRRNDRAVDCRGAL